jgi:molybdate transport system ATP-binding protein
LGRGRIGAMTHSARAALRVRLRHVDLRRDDRQILKDITWDIRPGERWALVGGNGAGKTQLLKILAGDVWPTPTRRSVLRYWSGRTPLELMEVKDAIAYVGAERQDKYERYGWNLTVAEVIATGVHASDLPLVELTAAERRRVAALVRRFRLAPLKRRRMLTLSYGERRRTLIARAFAMRPRLLLLDEVFNGLDAANRKRLHAALDSLARTRIPWVIATHRAEDVPKRVTHWAQLAKGRLRRLRKAPAALTEEKPRARRARASGSDFAAGAAPAVIELKHVSIYRDYRPVLMDVNWTIRAGEQWALLGANGEGKSTLLKMIYGDFPPALGGVIWRRGHQSGRHIEEFKRRVGWVSPELQSELVRLDSIEELVLSGIYASAGLNERPTRADVRRARACLKRFDLGARAAVSPRRVSYGELRRALIARALVNDPWLLLLDEPCTGLDVSARGEMLTHLERVAQGGVQIILATHHMQDFIPSIGRIARLARGRLVVER